MNYALPDLGYILGEAAQVATPLARLDLAVVRISFEVGDGTPCYLKIPAHAARSNLSSAELRRSTGESRKIMTQVKEMAAKWAHPDNRKSIRMRKAKTKI